MRPLPKFFISGDWGTTNFRLRLVETASLSVLAEHQTDQGIRTIYEKYLAQREGDQQQFFTNYLNEQIQVLPADHRQHLVVLSGMASSNIGLQELDYAEMPFEGSGGRLVWKHIPFPEGSGIILVSGAKSAQGMMRGEETQAVGMEEHLQPFGMGVLLLPGTHSKHITYCQGEFTGLKTFMTGELFELLSRKSILANNVQNSLWSEAKEEAFKEGLNLGLEGKLTESLFWVRARHLLQNARKEDNYYLLSGMLIGDELSYLKNEKNKIFLVAPDPVFSMYQLALRTVLPPQQVVLFDGKALEQALLAGQKKILARYGQ